jgi:hypothetical protein
MLIALLKVGLPFPIRPSALQLKSCDLSRNYKYTNKKLIKGVLKEDVFIKAKYLKEESFSKAFYLFLLRFNALIFLICISY